MAIVKYALIMVFEYRKVNRFADTPQTLLAMNVDLNKAYSLSVERFGIPPGNITIVTDIRQDPAIRNAWEPLSPNPLKRPKIVRLATPDIKVVCREMSQFVENTVRGIREVVSKGPDTRHEIFTYISCHGALIPSLDGFGKDNALILTTDQGTSRCYLRDDNLFRILFGQLDVDDAGRMSVSITRCHRPKRTFYEDQIDYMITPAQRRIDVNDPDEYDMVLKSPSGKYFIPDRGVPEDSHMLVIVDSCHSGTVTDFHYVYDPHMRGFKPTMKFDYLNRRYPTCICLAAAQDQEDAPSTPNGSIFTRYLVSVFNELKHSINIADFYDLLYEHLPKILGKCKPTITSTIDDVNIHLPFLN